MGREDINDAVDRLGRRVRMERREGQMARLRDTKRGFDSLEVTHLTDEHDVGIFTQCGAKRVRETVGIRVNLPLVHQALLMIVEILNRILDGDDVLRPLFVDLVEHGRERRGLAAARRSSDEHEAARLFANLSHNRRKSELFETFDLIGDRSVDGPRPLHAA